MATRVLPFKVTIPAETPQSAPVNIPLAMDNWVIERLDLQVPAGPAGLMGFQIVNNGVPWIPYGADGWIVWDDAQDSYYLTDQPTGAGWSVQGYNSDVFPHAVYLRLHVSPPQDPGAETTPPLPTFITQQAPDTQVVTL